MNKQSVLLSTELNNDKENVCRDHVDWAHTQSIYFAQKILRQLRTIAYAIILVDKKLHWTETYSDFCLCMVMDYLEKLLLTFKCDCFYYRMEFQCHKVSANELNIRDIKFITIMFTLVFG